MTDEARSSQSPSDGRHGSSDGRHGSSDGERHMPPSLTSEEKRRELDRAEFKERQRKEWEEEEINRIRYEKEELEEKERLRKEQEIENNKSRESAFNESPDYDHPDLSSVDKETRLTKRNRNKLLGVKIKLLKNLSYPRDTPISDIQSSFKITMKTKHGKLYKQATKLPERLPKSIMIFVLMHGFIVGVITTPIKVKRTMAADLGNSFIDTYKKPTEPDIGRELKPQLMSLHYKSPAEYKIIINTAIQHSLQKALAKKGPFKPRELTLKEQQENVFRKDKIIPVISDLEEYRQGKHIGKTTTFLPGDLMYNKSYQPEIASDNVSFIIIRGGPGTKAEDDIVVSINDYGKSRNDIIHLSEILLMVKMLGAEEVHLFDFSCNTFHPNYDGHVEDFKYYGGKTKKVKKR